MLYSWGALVVSLFTWFDVWKNADVIRTGNHPELIPSTARVGTFTSIIGWVGILLNNRSFLTSVINIVHSVSKTSVQWSGYFNPFVAATTTQCYYVRGILPS